MSNIEKVTLHIEGQNETDIYPKTSIDQVVNLENDLNQKSTDIINLQDRVSTNEDDIRGLKFKVETIPTNIFNGRGEDSLEQLYTKEPDEQTTLVNNATGKCSIAFGKGCNASGKRAVAIGNQCTAEENCSFTIGQVNTNAGIRAFVGGRNNTNSGNDGIVFGENGVITGSHNIVNGVNQTVSGSANLVIGRYQKVSNNQNIVGGYSNTISVGNSLVVGDTLKATLNERKFVFGLNNKEKQGTIVEIANAASANDVHNSNIFEVYKDKIRVAKQNNVGVIIEDTTKSAFEVDAVNATIKIGNTTLSEQQLIALLALIGN